MTENSQDALPPKPSFVDADGNRHIMNLTFGSANRIREKFDVDLIDISDGKAFVAMGSNSALLLSVVWELVSNKTNREDPSEIEAFAEAIDGPTVERMGVAIKEAIILFSPPAKRPAVRALFSQADDAIDKTGDAMLELVESDEVAQGMDLVLAEQTKTARMRMPLVMAEAAGVSEEVIEEHGLRQKATSMETTTVTKAPRRKRPWTSEELGSN